MAGMDWLEYRNGNFYCVPGDFWLDPSRPARRAVISHAHGDHFPRFSGEVWGTPRTLEIARTRFKKTSAKKAHAIPFKQQFSIGPVELTFWPAGHILGSAQVFMRFEGKTALFSGDISLDPNPTCLPLEVPDQHPDLLICESTFGEKPSHPDAEKELQRLFEAAGDRKMLIGTYALGKAQRITRMINDHFPEREIYVHAAIATMHAAYQKAGIELGSWSHFRRKEAKLAGDQLVYLVPPRILSGYANEASYFKSMASGWNFPDKFPWLDANLEISDHASQQEIEKYIHSLSPKEVWFWHGYPDSLTKWCTQQGIPVKSFVN